MPTISFLNAVRTSMGEQIVAAIDAGTGPGTLDFYTAAQPASANVAVSDQVLLGTLTFSDPCATVTAGVVAFDAITQDNAADASGTATWARAYDSEGAAVCDFNVSDLAGTGAIKMNTVTVVAGGPILINSLSITVG